VRGRLELGWLHARLLARSGGAILEPPVCVAEYDQTPSDASLNALGRAIDSVLGELAAVASLRGARLQVELGGSLAHVDVVEGDFDGESDRRLQAIAKACVAELLGDGERDHETCWQLQRDGKHLLIGALSRGLLHLLSQAATRLGMSLASVQPDLCVQWNRHAEALGTGAAVFAAACGGDAVVASVRDGTITALSSGAWLDRSGTTSALDNRVDRLLAGIGAEPTESLALLLVAPEPSGVVASPRWTVTQRELQAT
jgi:hypothetical protein